jgi:hypothetical protein
MAGRKVKKDKPIILKKKKRVSTLPKPIELFRILLQPDQTTRIEIRAVPSMDPGAIGFILADITANFARLYHEALGCTEEEAQNRIIELFTAEVAHPTVEHVHGYEYEQGKGANLDG